MAKAKKAVRRAWTKDDVRTMKTMAKAKSGVTKIARALKRTPGATTAMAAKLGVSLSTRADGPEYALSPCLQFALDYAARGLTTA